MTKHQKLQNTSRNIPWCSSMAIFFHQFSLRFPKNLLVVYIPDLYFKFRYMYYTCFLNFTCVYTWLRHAIRLTIHIHNMVHVNAYLLNFVINKYLLISVFFLKHLSVNMWPYKKYSQQTMKIKKDMKYVKTKCIALPYILIWSPSTECGKFATNSSTNAFATTVLQIQCLLDN